MMHPRALGRVSRVALAATVCTFLLSVAAWGGSSFAEASRVFEEQITSDLRARDSAAADLFSEANAARVGGDHSRAADLYRRVIERNPDFDHARRRLAMEVLELGDRDGAIQLARQAVAARPSAENLSALAACLIRRSGDTPPSRESVSEALELARQAVDLSPNDAFVRVILCEVALADENERILESASERLSALAPDEVAGPYFHAIAEATQGNFWRAERDLERARSLGLAEAEYQRLKAAFAQAQPWHERLLLVLAPVVGVWLAGFGVFFGAAAVMSRATLRAVASLRDKVSPDATAGESRLRRIYRGLIWLCGVYYWVSMPFVVLAVCVVAAGAVSLWLTLTGGLVSIRLMVFLAIVFVTTLVAVARSVFVRGSDADPGVHLEASAEPAVYDVLRDVAQKVGTRPVDTVFLTPGAEVAVFERGGLRKQLAGSGERCLILGVGVLEGMTLRPLKAILAHEYGHYSNRDTAGGGLALAVRRSVHTMALELAGRGVARWYNPAWLFVNGFYRMFNRVSQGASRLQEVLADRWAAFAYGSEAFEAGLRHVVERSVVFGAHATATLREVTSTGRPLPNLYTHRPQDRPHATDIAEGIRAELEREPSPYDSHPSPKQRIEWVRALGVAGSESGGDDAVAAWELFRDRASIEQRLTKEIRDQVAKYDGIVIRAEA